MYGDDNDPVLGGGFVPDRSLLKVLGS